MRGERERVAALVGVSNDLTSGITGYRDLCRAAVHAAGRVNGEGHQNPDRTDQSRLEGLSGCGDDFVRE